MISIRSESGVYNLEAELHLPISLEEAWSFFSSPKNLVKMTPEHMKFAITSGEPKPMYAGQVITYDISSIPGVKSTWVSEITLVEHKKCFVDEQRSGPFKMWHHKHIFEATADGILIKDKVTYKLPLGILGRLAHTLFVRRKLTQIFSYRLRVMKEMFPE